MLYILYRKIEKFFVNITSIYIGVSNRYNVKIIIVVSSMVADNDRLIMRNTYLI